MQFSQAGPLYILRGHSLKFISLNFVLAYSVDPDEMPHPAAFHLGLHNLQMYLLRGFQFVKG